MIGMKRYSHKGKQSILYIHSGDFSNVSANRLQVLSMCEAFDLLGHTIHLLGVCNTNGPFRTIEVGHAFVRAKNHLLRSIRLIRSAKTMASEYDIIMTRDLLVAWYFSRKGHRVIYEMHTVSRSLVWKTFLHLTVPRLHKLVAINTGLYRALSTMDIPVDRVEVIPSGVDMDSFDIRLSQKNARKRLNLRTDKHLVMYAGSLKKEKGVETLLEATAPLKKEVLVWIVGGTRKRVHKLKKRYSHARFTGQVSHDDIPTYLKAADCLVLPNSSRVPVSARYTSPLKLFEYMAVKRPIVASNLASIHDTVSRREVDFFTPDNPDSLEGTLLRLLSNRERQKKLSENAYKKVKGMGWKKRAKKVLA